MLATRGLVEKQPRSEKAQYATAHFVHWLMHSHAQGWADLAT